MNRKLFSKLENTYLTKMAERHAKCDPLDDYKIMKTYHIYHKNNNLRPIWPNLTNKNYCTNYSEAIKELKKLNKEFNNYKLVHHEIIIENNINIRILK